MIWLAIKGGIAMAIAFIVSFIALPIMAHIYASPTWDGASDPAIIQRENVMSEFQYFPIILAGLYIAYMVFSAARRQPEEYSYDDNYGY